MPRLLLVLLLLGQTPAGLKTQTGAVTGIVRTDTGIPLEGVRVAVTPADQSIADNVLESLGLTDSAGRYRLENVSPGRYNVLFGRRADNISGDLYTTVMGRRGLTTYLPGVAKSDQATTIQVTAGSILEAPEMVFARNVTGRVIDMATGKGRRIENLVLCCDYSQPLLMGNGVAAAATFTTVISDDGSFVFPSVPAGNYALSTADPKVIPVTWALAVGNNGAAGLQLNVSEGVEVQGAVLDQSGAPVTASVRLRPKPTDAVFDTISPPTNSTVKGWILTPKAEPSLDGLRERLFNSANIHAGTLASDGRFALPTVLPGTYILEVSSLGVPLLTREIEVGAAGTTSLSLQSRGVSLAGRIVAPSGSALPKLNYIRLVRSGSDADVFYGFPNSDGQFSLTLLPGQYRVFTERLGPSVQSVSDGSRDITNTELTLEGGRNQQIVVTLEP